MIDAGKLVDVISGLGGRFYTGVPDSLLSKFSAGVMSRSDVRHLIAANEGNAVGLAIGEYLATDQPSVVYMQNSGLGNTVNPLVSLADPAVYSIPMFLIIGWRGEPGVHDEPQHVKQGEITIGQLNIMGIPYAILSESTDAESIVSNLWGKMIERQGPVALIVRKGALGGEYSVDKKQANSSMLREQALETLVTSLPDSACLIATTGKTGRELYEIRERNQAEQRDFLTVGGMGHASSIALGIALHEPERWTVCLDGDGAALMHLGAMATLATAKPKKYLHVLLNNYAHESVGGQPTIADQVDFCKLSEAVGYTGYKLAETPQEIEEACRDILPSGGCWLLEVRVKQGSRANLGRPKKTPIQNKLSVMKFLSE